MDRGVPLLGALKDEAHHGELCVQNRGRRSPLSGNGKRVGSCDQVRPGFDLVDWIPRKLVNGRAVIGALDSGRRAPTVVAETDCDIVVVNAGTKVDDGPEPKLGHLGCRTWGSNRVGRVWVRGMVGVGRSGPQA